MKNLISIIIVGFASIFSTIIVWHKLLNKKINFKSLKLYIVIILLTGLSLINYFNSNVFLRISTITVILMIFFKILFNENIQKTIITPIFSQMIVMVSESIFCLVVSILFNYDSQDIVETQFAQIFSNITIAFLNCLIVKIPSVEKIYKFLLNATDRINKKFLIILSFFLIVVANILAGVLYYKVNYIYLLIFNTSLTVMCLIIISYSYITQNKYNKVYDKYKTTLNSLKEYEDILDKYRVSNHENKNQLLTIRNMLSNKNKKVTKYIDEIVDNTLKDDEKVMFEVSRIPAGGLRGLVYSKVLYIKQNNINYELNISKEIRTVDLINNLEENDILDVCRIIGVYIDNAIDAVSKIDNKFINITMYLEDKAIVFEISNSYDGKIEINKLEQKGYTTKGFGHGYGLPLTREIISNNKKLTNEKKLSKETFTQILKIKM